MAEKSDKQKPVAAVVLAAGKGDRMQSDLPKVAHPVADRPMIEWIVDACREVGASPIVLVVGHGQEVIRTLFGDAPDVEFAVQAEQLGTAHAVDAARSILERLDGDVFVLGGDGPLIRSATLEQILQRHRETRAAATLATSIVDDPTGYGRVIRDADGMFDLIVEHKNATEDQRSVREVNPSYYCFRIGALLAALDRVERNELSGEYYVTDVPGILKADGARVEVIDAVPAEDVLSINTPQQLAEVDAILRSRLEVCS